MNNCLLSPQVDGTDSKEPSRAGSPSLRLHSFWNVEPVYIQVNHTVFVVPRDAFQESNSGSLFEAVGLASPSVIVQDIEGLSKTRPIVLENVTEREFEIFLQAIYPASLSEKSKIDIVFEDWTAVLRLSAMWNHEVARKQAVDSLTKILNASSDAAYMLRLGKEHSVTQWTRHAYIALVRNTSIGLNELVKEPFELDWETIAKITQAKYEAMPKPIFSTSSSSKKIALARQSCLNCNESYLDSAGALRICLCRATTMVEEYFPDLKDFKSAQTPASSTSPRVAYPEY